MFRADVFIGGTRWQGRERQGWLIRMQLPKGMWRVPRWPADDRKRWPIVLMYHSVLNVRRDAWGLRVSPRCFYEHMAVLRANADLMRLDELTEALESDRLPRRPVIVTFDDGYPDNLVNAKPVLEQFAIPATIFVATGYVGSQREFWWDELELLLLNSPCLPRYIELTVKNKLYRYDLGNDATLSLLTRFKWRHWRAWHEMVPTARHQMFLEVRQLLRLTGPQDREQALQTLRAAAGQPFVRATRRCVSLEQLRELASGNLVEIGGHTVTHSSLGALSPQEQRMEITNGKAWLEQQLNRKVTSFAYPFGGPDDYNEDTIRILKECGIQRSCITASGSVTPALDRYEYPRRSVLNWSGGEFLSKLQRWLEVRDERIVAPQHEFRDKAANDRHANKSMSLPSQRSKRTSIEPTPQLD